MASFSSLLRLSHPCTRMNSFPKIGPYQMPPMIIDATAAASTAPIVYCHVIYIISLIVANREQFHYANGRPWIKTIPQAHDARHPARHANCCCALLLTAALVALRGMQRSLHAPLGIQPEGVITADTDLHMAGYTDQSSLAVEKRMLEQFPTAWGTAVGAINEPPLNTGGSSTSVYRQGTTDFRDSNSAFAAKYFSISPDYFRAAGTRLLSGRDLSWHDDATTPKVALVNIDFRSHDVWRCSAHWASFPDWREGLV